MSIVEKIKSLYPDIKDSDFIDCIKLRNDSNGKGDYIEEWNHPSLPKPSDKDLEL